MYVICYHARLGCTDIAAGVLTPPRSSTRNVINGISKSHIYSDPSIPIFFSLQQPFY